MQAQERRVARRFFIDTNVFMRTAQCHIPDLTYLCEQSRKFLDDHGSHCVVDDVVVQEVQHQLSTNKDDYRGAKDVRRRVGQCEVLDLAKQADLVERLILAYGRNGWGGGTSDNDKYHAASATAYGITDMVTWDKDFRSQEDWVNAINAEFDLAPVRFVSPDKA